MRFLQVFLGGIRDQINIMFESDDEDSEVHCIITLDVNCARDVYESLKYRLEQLAWRRSARADKSQ